ncbi:hypothetical protein Gohar_010518 [Gossypium harknessii]|uniref:Uncharacterized protein n=1 Tax=Gossypium harknessii TaxID=34285 RepID=A0A7J9GSK3_9ROSI|nr:hypothetical protein [Gossypium harknessii]
MSGSGGVSIARSRGGESRFYNPPPMRKQQQLQQQQQQQQMTTTTMQRREQRPPSISKGSTEKRTDHEDCATLLPSSSSSSSSANNSSKTNDDNSTNLDRFLEFTTPVVSAQYLPKTSIRGCRGQERGLECPPYFALKDLWESFKEWSAYGAGVPLLLNGSDSVMQYYVPYLSGIQLYVDPSRPYPRQRVTVIRNSFLLIWRVVLLESHLMVDCCVEHAGYVVSFSNPSLNRMPGEESDTESSRETSSDGSDSDYGVARRANNIVPGSWNQLDIADANIQRLNTLSLRNRPFGGSSSDESDTCNPLGQLIFEYLEHDQPFSREPLADKISVLASQFPALRTYRSCDLSPSSWISVAWYPIYRIPMGPTLQNLDACFLTYHSLSTPLPSGNGTDGLPFRGFNVREFHDADMSLKLPLPTFGLAFYKFKVSVWNPDGVNESQKANSLLQAADNWLRLLQVNHPDFRHEIPVILRALYQRHGPEEVGFDPCELVISLFGDGDDNNLFDICI